MKLIDVTEVNIQFSDLKTHKPKTPVKRSQDRSPGVHLSDIIRYLHFASKPVVDKQEVINVGAELDDPTVMNLRMVIGMAWEAFIVGFYPDLVWQPKELKVDGIAGSMDGYTFADYEDNPVVEEFKYTHKSCRGPRDVLKEDVLWIRQVKAYCYMKTRLDDTNEEWRWGRLHVCYGNGDYNRPYQERYFKYLIEFEMDELERFWKQAIVKNKSAAMAWKVKNGY